MKPVVEAAAGRLLVATSNPNKLREIRRLLEGSERPPDKGVAYDLLTLADLPPVPEPDETAATFWENARIKALTYAQATGLTTVAEDSGFEIDALGGRPGVLSARFLAPSASYADRFAEIYRQLELDKPGSLSPPLSFQESPYSARFITALAVARGRELIFETETSIEGLVAPAPSGAHGFGYDPIFWYPPFGQTTADMADHEKAAVSHRARAFRDLQRWLGTRSDLFSLRTANGT